MAIAAKLKNIIIKSKIVRIKVLTNKKGPLNLFREGQILCFRNYS